MDYSKVKVNPATRGLEYLADGELCRRRRVLQDVMKKNNVRAMMMQRNWDGYDRWLNNIFTFGPLNSGVFVVPAEGIGVATQGYPLLSNGRAKGREGLALYSKKDELVDWLTDCDLLDVLGDRLIEDGMAEDDDITSVKDGNCKLVSGLGYKDLLDMMGSTRRLGVLYPDKMRTDIYDYLTTNIPDIELVDITQAINAAKAVKSDNELEVIAEIAKQHDKVFNNIASILNAGVLEPQIVNRVRYLAYRAGSYGFSWFSNVLIDMSSTPDGKDEALDIPDYPGRALNDGDRINIRMQAIGMSGYFGSIGRCWILGTPSEQTVKCWKTAVEAQHYAASLMVPGATLKDIHTATDKWIKAKGFNAPIDNYIHGIGYVPVERPFLNDKSESIVLKEEMVFSIHPSIGQSKLGEPQKAAYVCDDMYIVCKDDAKRLTKFTQDLIAL
jgi:Xaa-Pro aminopeptidase